MTKSRWRRIVELAASKTNIEEVKQRLLNDESGYYEDSAHTLFQCAIMNPMATLKSLSDAVDNMVADEVLSLTLRRRPDSQGGKS